MKRITLFIAAVLAFAVIGAPAQAAKHTPPAQSHKCVAHTVSYRVAGTLDAPGALTAETDGTYSGTLTVHVLRTNRHAKGDKGSHTTYTLDHARVGFGPGVDKTAPAAGTWAKLKGTITFLPKKCGTSTPTINIKRVRLHNHHS